MAFQVKRQYFEFINLELDSKNDFTGKIIGFKNEAIDRRWSKEEFINIGKRLNFQNMTMNAKVEYKNYNGINNTGYKVVAKEIWQQDQFGHIDDNIVKKTRRMTYKFKTLSHSSTLLDFIIIRLLSSSLTSERLNLICTFLPFADETRKLSDQLWSLITAVVLIVLGLLSILFL